MENKTSLRNSQTRGDEGDMTTKYNAVSQMVSWNRKKNGISGKTGEIQMKSGI